jgi:type I restriction-modification system DNA methylase subunit
MTTMAGAAKEAQRAELHKTIWPIATDLRGSVEGGYLKSYVLGIVFYRYRSENLTAYITEGERQAGATTKILPPASRFSAKGGHGEKKQRVLEKLGAFFERFFRPSSGGSN